MKSLIVTNASCIPDDVKELFTDLQVLSDEYGYFVGTQFNADGIMFPGSRDSRYFATRREAAECLQHMIATHPDRRPDHGET